MQGTLGLRTNAPCIWKVSPSLTPLPPYPTPPPYIPTSTLHPYLYPYIPTPPPPYVPTPTVYPHPHPASPTITPNPTSDLLFWIPQILETNILSQGVIHVTCVTGYL